jgi:DNA-binding winged helix-turn-helix (wHTH) protein
VRFTFGPFTLDGNRRLLLRDDVELHIAPKTLELLLVIVQRAPNAVSKAELMSALWPDTHVSDATLTGVVADARDALGDDGRAPRLIRTMHRFGYAFTGQLDCDPGTDRTAPVLGWLICDSWRVPLRAGETVLGREGDGVVPLPSPSVSRRHAALTVEGSAARLSDLGSKNGTFVDETKVDQPIALRDGARLRFGTLEVTYRSAGLTSSTDTV